MEQQDLVLWVDEFVLAVNKPPGLPTLPDGYHPEAPHVRSLLEPFWGRLWIVHRLDRDTSGVLVLARNPTAHRSLNRQFQEHQVIKMYHALVIGDPPWDEQSTIEMPLRVDADRRHRTRIDFEAGKYALTRVKVIERFGPYSLIEALPVTGRTHQVRAHLAAVGFPLVGDLLYGRSGAITQRCDLATEAGQFPFERVGLHAFSLSIRHPDDGRALLFQAPYPQDFAAVLQALRVARSAEEDSS